MLALYASFSSEYSLIFNAKKSKCLMFPSKSHGTSCVCDKPIFVVGGNVIEYVDEWPHLGHVFTKDFNDVTDMIAMIGQINSVLCYFAKLDYICV
jgi:hypothetical protein